MNHPVKAKRLTKIKMETKMVRLTTLNGIIHNANPVVLITPQFVCLSVVDADVFYAKMEEKQLKKKKNNKIPKLQRTTAITITENHLTC